MEKQFVTISEVEQKPVHWLWPSRIAYGSLTLLVGYPGTGKGALVADIVARITSGRPMYECGGRPRPHGVILISGEDDLSTAIKPRLRAANAATRLVRALDCSSGFTFQLPTELRSLERELVDSGARLVVLDPIMEFIEGNANSDKAIRRALSPLAGLARRTGTAVVLVHHLNKSGGPALQRAAGSIGIVGLVHSVLLTVQLPHDPARCVVAHLKSNLGPLARSLSFNKQDSNGAVVISWVGESRYSADELLCSIACEEGSSLNEAMRVLFSVLGQGPVVAKTARRLASDAGIAPATLKRAKKALGVESQRKGFGKGSHFFWSLCEESSIVRQFREEELASLSDRLFHGSDEDDLDDSADWWKRGPLPQ